MSINRENKGNKANKRGALKDRLLVEVEKSMGDAIINGEEKSVQDILKYKKVNINSDLDEYKNSPLMYAVMYGKTNIVNLILEAKADPNKSNHYGSTPLIWNCREEKIDIEVIKKLMSHKADVNLKDKLGRSALDYALKNKNLEVANYLLSNGANITNDEEISLSMDINNKRKIGNALDFAMDSGNLAAVTYLLDHHAHIVNYKKLNHFLLSKKSELTVDQLKLIESLPLIIKEQENKAEMKKVWMADKNVKNACDEFEKVSKNYIDLYNAHKKLQKISISQVAEKVALSAKLEKAVINLIKVFNNKGIDQEQLRDVLNKKFEIVKQTYEQDPDTFGTMQNERGEIGSLLRFTVEDDPELALFLVKSGLNPLISSKRYAVLGFSGPTIYGKDYFPAFDLIEFKYNPLEGKRFLEQCLISASSNMKADDERILTNIIMQNVLSNPDSMKSNIYLSALLKVTLEGKFPEIVFLKISDQLKNGVKFFPAYEDYRNKLLNKEYKSGDLTFTADNYLRYSINAVIEFINEYSVKLGHNEEKLKNSLQDQNIKLHSILKNIDAQGQLDIEGQANYARLFLSIKNAITKLMPWQVKGVHFLKQEWNLFLKDNQTIFEVIPRIAVGLPDYKNIPKDHRTVDVKDKEEQILPPSYDDALSQDAIVNKPGSIEPSAPLAVDEKTVIEEAYQFQPAIDVEESMRIETNAEPSAPVFNLDEENNIAEAYQVQPLVDNDLVSETNAAPSAPDFEEGESLQAPISNIHQETNAEPSAPVFHQPEIVEPTAPEVNTNVASEDLFNNSQEGQVNLVNQDQKNSAVRKGFANSGFGLFDHNKTGKSAQIEEKKKEIAETKEKDSKEKEKTTVNKQKPISL